MKTPINTEIIYDYIAIEGNIGSGKTTLSQMVAEKLGANLITESFETNPFLPLFYENPARYALPVEIFFLTERQRQLQEELLQPPLFKQKVITDYCFTKTLLFAKSNLNEVEFELFKRLYVVMANAFPSPDIIVYLHRPADSLLHFIQKRNRSYELDIQAAYLEAINKRYHSYFKTETNFPILILDMGNQDFIKKPKLFKKIFKLLKKDHPNGISYIDFSEN